MDMVKGWMWDILKGMAWQFLGGINWWLVAAVLIGTLTVLAVLGKLLGRAGKAALAFGTAFLMFAVGSWMLRPPAPPPVVVHRPIEIKVPELPEVSLPDLSGLSDALKSGAQGFGRLLGGMGDALAKMKLPDTDPEEEARRRAEAEAARIAELARQKKLAQELARRRRREMARQIGMAQGQAMWAEIDRVAAQNRMADQMRLQQAMGQFGDMLSQQQQTGQVRPVGR